MSWEIYTDGACLGNPGPGGWAFVVFENGKEKYAHAEGAEDTTNNRMELYAAIMACEYSLLGQAYQTSKKTIGSENPVVIFTDSKYVQQGVTLWCQQWAKKNWRGSKGEIKNLDLWKRLYALNEINHIKWEWVKGHSGDPKNDRADFLASTEAKKIKSLQKLDMGENKQTIDTHNNKKNESEKVESEERFYLNVPYKEKDHAKKCGARWDQDKRQWYVEMAHKEKCVSWFPTNS